MRRGNFVLLSNLFPWFREHGIVSKLKKKIHDTTYMQAYIYSVSFSYYFHFLLFESKSKVKFYHKNFPLLIVSHYHWTRNRKSVADESWNPRACNYNTHGFWWPVSCDYWEWNWIVFMYVSTVQLLNMWIEVIARNLAS